MNIALLVLHVILSLGIITLVLLQKGAGASAGAAFGGGGGAGSVFGASGSANFLSKFTAILATGFFLNSLALAYVAAHRDVTVDSVLDSLNAPAKEVVIPASTENHPEEVIPAAEHVPAAETDDMPPADIPPPPEAMDAETMAPESMTPAAEQVSDVPPVEEADKE